MSLEEHTHTHMWELLSEKMYHSSVHVKDLYINRKREEKKRHKENKKKKKFCLKLLI